MSIAADSIDVASAGSPPVLVTVVATAGFQQPVQLSCLSGMPAGYECSFSPASLYTGNSYLRIQPSSKAAMACPGTGWLYGPALGIFSFLLIGAVRPRRVLCLVLLMAGLGFTTMIGCGNPSAAAQQPQLTVLSIRATVGTGGGTIVHSAQILLNMRSSE